MAIANLHEILLAYTMRKNALQVDIAEAQSRKALAVAQRADNNSLLSAGKAEIRNRYKELYASDEELQAQYKDYTDIPDFEEEIDKITAQLTDELNDIADWETQIDNQITTDSAELEEINAYMDSMKNMLSSNIQEDFKHGLN